MMRQAPSIERRAAADIRRDGRRLEGYAAVFGAEARIADFTETIAPGAFAASLAEKRDILALLDHDARAVLARTRSGTLRLSEDTRGLVFSLDVPDTTHGNDALSLAERGDLGGASFGFRVAKGGQRWEGSRRTLLHVDLLEISVVSSHPAYAETSVSARSQAAADRARLALLLRLA